MPSASLLVVEDSAGDAELYRTWLVETTELRCEVAMVKRWRDAVDTVSTNPPDIAIVDLGLPDSGTSQTLARLGHLCADTVVIVVTGNADDATGFHALRAGAREFLDKNALDSDSLVRAVLHALRTREAPHSSVVLADAAEPLVVLSHDGIVRFANRGAARLLHRYADELIGAPIGLPITGAGCHEVKLKSGHRELDVEAHVSGLEWEGEPAYLAWLLDVTERRRARTLERRLTEARQEQDRATLAATMAHEINNPLAALLTNLQLAAALATERLGKPDSELHELLGEAAGCAHRIAGVVRDVREMTRDDRSLRLETTSPQSLVDAACALMRGRLEDGVELSVEAPDDLPDLDVDVSKLGRALVNLLDNAIDAVATSTARTDHHVGVEVWSNDRYVTFSVSDDGVGMADETLSRAFEPFFSTKAKDGGTGLGLAVVNQVAELHGGCVNVRSRPGHGTRVDIVLPIRRRSAPAPTPTPSEQPRRAALPRLRILVVDDDSAVLRATTRLLARHHDVVGCVTPDEALARIADDPRFDAVLCDMVMPSMDGLSLRERIAAQHPQLAARFVFMTGATGTNVGDGPPALSKPFSRDQLEDALERVTRNH